MSFSESNSTGLPGLKRIRESLGMMGVEVARLSGVTAQWISQLETQSSDCTDNLKRKIGEALCCTPADLLSTPTPQRLAEIKAAYTQRVAEQAAADLAKLQ